MTQQYSNF